MTIILVTIIIIAALDNNFLLSSPGNLDPIRSIMRLVKMNYLSHFKIVLVCIVSPRQAAIAFALALEIF